MNGVLTPQTRPAWLLAPGLMMAVVCSTALALLKTASGGVPEGVPASEAQLLVLAGIVGAFTGFLAVLVYSAIVWIYGRAVRAQGSDFVRALALVAFVFGFTAVLRLLIGGVELAVTGDVSPVPITDLGRHLGGGLRGFDLTDLLAVVLLYAGARRYLRYGAKTAAGLALVLLLLNAVAGAIG
jgi:hypothetical protein